MLRNSIDRSTCDSRLLFVALIASGLASTLGCGSEDDASDTDADTETDTAALDPGTPMGPTPNGLSLPVGVQDWLPIGAAARADNGTLRVIVGNDIAVTAARAGETNPWPEGTMLSHLMWEAVANASDPTRDTIGPGAFGGVTLMVKDSEEYAEDGGWAYGVWAGPELTPPSDPEFDRACVNCHTDLVSNKDFVFTVPGQLPDPAAINGAVDAPNGVAFPSRILDWRVIGIADILSDTPTLRVIVGNQTAVDAARSGQTDPWPDGSMISHYNWAAGENVEAGPNTVAPGNFNAITLMQRSGARYEADGAWAYGVWRTASLTPLDAGFDRACVACHTENVADRDMVFTEVGELPAALLELSAAP